MNTVTVSAQIRTNIGKTPVKATRALGLIPAIVYGNETPQAISVNKSEVKHLIYTPEFKIAEVTIDGKTQKCILKDYQMDPVTEQILHIDFLRLKEGVPVKVQIPVSFIGLSPGVKAGGKLVQQIRKIGIKTTPKYLVDKIEVDISKLELSGVLRVKEIILNENIEILIDGSNPLATVEVPRALKSAASADAKAAVGTKKKPVAGAAAPAESAPEAK